MLPNITIAVIIWLKNREWDSKYFLRVRVSMEILQLLIIYRLASSYNRILGQVISCVVIYIITDDIHCWSNIWMTEQFDIR